MILLMRYWSRCPWAAPLAAAVLLASCQSTRPAFLVAPTASYAEVARPLAPPQLVVAAPTSPAPAIERPCLPHATQPPSLRLPRRVAALQWQPAATLAAHPSLVVATALAREVAPARLVRPHRHHAAPAHTAESGLGHIAVFFIAVFLGVLVGVGALVSLIPGVSLLGGIGLAAAGLVVLFLLYSLFSGGKKKKPATR